MPATPVKTFVKDPAAVLDYTMRWRRWLKGDTISAAPTITAPAGINVNSSVWGGDSVVLWLSGGTDGVTYAVAVQIVTAGGRTDSRTVAFRCAAR